VLDVALASLGLILLAPLFLLVAVLIKLRSSGPVFFTQERVGSRRRNRNGRTVWEVRTFSFYKFRSMRSDADSSIHRHYIRQFCEGRPAHHGSDGAIFKLKDDPRVTRIGRILRKTSIDELPQLVNVLKGDMSLVGPRPLPLYEVAQHKREYFGRLAGLGGITGVWQVRGRGRVPMEEMMRMDIEYVRRPSLWLDLKLLFLTVPCVLPKRGAE
jgi:lipopolysaccharide/colanic/teichoic acid biosynthesis glycosyltransferase